MSEYTLDTFFMSMIVLLILMYATIIVNTPTLTNTIQNNTLTLIFNNSELLIHNNKGQSYSLQTQNITIDKCSFTLSLYPGEKIEKHSENLMIINNKVFIVGYPNKAFIRTNKREISITVKDKQLKIYDDAKYIYVHNPSCFVKDVLVNNKTIRISPNTTIKVNKALFDKITINNITFNGSKITIPRLSYTYIKLNNIILKPYIIQKSINDNYVIFTTNINGEVTIIGKTLLKENITNNTIYVPITIVPDNKTLIFKYNNITIIKYVILNKEIFKGQQNKNAKIQTLYLSAPEITTSKDGILLNISSPENMTVRIIMSTAYYEETIQYNITQGINTIHIPYKIYNPITDNDLVLIKVVKDNMTIAYTTTYVVVVKPKFMITLSDEQRVIRIMTDEPIFTQLTLNIYYYLDNGEFKSQTITIPASAKIFVFSTPEYVRGKIIGIEYKIWSKYGLVATGIIS